MRANKKAAAAATTATGIMKSLTSSTSNAIVRKTEINCKISEISACVALALVLIATGLMEWHPLIALMLLVPAIAMATVLRAFTSCLTSAVKSRADNAPSRTAGTWATASPAPSTARRSSRWTGRTLGGDDISW